MQQHKLEFKGKNFFLRGYTTSEDGGQSYDMLFTGINATENGNQTLLGLVNMLVLCTIY
jgi:hypothetical protein